MGFIAGLKGVFKKPLYIFIISSFTLTWIMIIINKFLSSGLLGLSVFIFGGSLLFFVLIIFIISFIKQINEMKWWFFVIIYVFSIILTFILYPTIFFPTSELFFVVPLGVNQFFQAFFAFKICMDSSTKIDDYLYQKEKSRIVTRIVEFCIFGFLNFGLSDLH